MLESHCNLTSLNLYRLLFPYQKNCSQLRCIFLKVTTGSHKSHQLNIGLNPFFGTPLLQSKEAPTNLRERRLWDDATTLNNLWGMSRRGCRECHQGILNTSPRKPDWCFLLLVLQQRQQRRRISTDLLPKAICIWKCFRLHGRSKVTFVPFLRKQTRARSQPDVYHSTRLPELWDTYVDVAFSAKCHHMAGTWT